MLVLRQKKNKKKFNKNFKIQEKTQIFNKEK